MLAVSLTSPHFRDEGLLGHVAHLNSAHRDGTYHECIISLGDTLHRHNLPDDGSGRAYGQAEALGNDWIARAGPALRQLDMPHVILRHGVVLGSSTYPMCREGLEALCREHDWFRMAVEADVAAFLSRDPGRSAIASRAYILEELAADISFSRIVPNIDHIYPGAMLSTYRVIREHAEELPFELRGLHRWHFIRTRPSKLARRLRAASSIVHAKDDAAAI